jgi:hypothetical protein
MFYIWFVTHSSMCGNGGGCCIHVMRRLGRFVRRRRHRLDKSAQIGFVVLANKNQSRPVLETALSQFWRPSLKSYFSFKTDLISWKLIICVWNKFLARIRLLPLFIWEDHGLDWESIYPVIKATSIFIFYLYLFQSLAIQHFSQWFLQAF